ncbi:MAG: (d)CMP kinase [Sphingobacteriales bacterium]|nr:MAG: (d)CMP kinase [Sphingobacteriales bacterium]
MTKKIIIAIDGFSSCGKSTLAKDLANKLGYRYIDTGAMYRAVTYYFEDKAVNIKEHGAVENALLDISIDFDYDENTGKQITILNGYSVEKEIRSPEISNKVSPVAAIKEVRSFLVAQQQKMGDHKGIVMDGRDIGTVVFPKAELKLFMTADEEIRIERRYDELKANGENIDLEDVRENIKRRDYIDTHRDESPLRQADDAIVVNNSNLTPEQQLQLVYEMVQKKVKE